MYLFWVTVFSNTKRCFQVLTSQQTPSYSVCTFIRLAPGYFFPIGNNSVPSPGRHAQAPNLIFLQCWIRPKALENRFIRGDDSFLFDKWHYIQCGWYDYMSKSISVERQNVKKLLEMLNLVHPSWQQPAHIHWNIHTWIAKLFME
jgi:hypothetical protein